nr:MAG TPA: hypothetical protein [Caudoviricetes sp.]DAK74868.1 MAG TPA: hypothetical protein [Caudoviricetes sp.]DAS55565.1 MAG TPA: hypothetical protein [Caudoviricetes sp.]
MNRKRRNAYRPIDVSYHRNRINRDCGIVR